MNKYLIILLSLLFPCVLLAQKGIRAVDNKGTIIYVDPSKWYQVGSNLFNKNTNGNVAIGIDTLSISIKPVDSRLYISNNNSTSIPVLKLDKPFDGELTDNVLTWNPADFSVGKIAISKLSSNDWHLLGNNGTDPATNFLGTTDNQPLMFRVNNTNSGMIGLESENSNTALGYQTLTNWTGVSPNNGQKNTAIGTNALALGGASLDNTAIGANTLSKLNSSSFSGNTAVGSSALSNANGTDPTSGRNTAVGFLSLTNTTTGSYNTALGASSLNANSIGSYNTALGNLALQNSTGNYNVAVGNTAGNIAGMTGNSNILIGGGSAVGATVNTSSLLANNELNIGNTLFGTGVNGAVGGTGGKIGVNTNTPIAALDVRGGSVRTGDLPLTAAPIGTNSFAGGTGSSAETSNSFAYGNGAKANGTTATAFGTSTASATLSFAAGSGNTVNGGASYSVLLGQSNNVYSTGLGTYPGYASFAAGFSNKIYAQNSAALGANNTLNSAIAPGSQSCVALGGSNTTDGTAAVVIGSGNKSTGNYSTAIGFQNTILSNATYSVAMGSTNTIGDVSTSSGSLAVGMSNKINGNFSTAIGQSNTISVSNGTIIGSNATVSHAGSTVFADISSSVIIGSSADNEFTGMYKGGYRLLTNRGDLTKGMTMNSLGNVIFSGTVSSNGLVIGSNATVSNTGSTVLADVSSSTPIGSTANNQFTGMFNGGYRLLTNRADLTKGMFMDIAGNVNFSGTVSSGGIVITSDMRLKKDIQDLTGVLNNIKQLRGVNYYWKDSSKGTDRQLGMIAQELEKVYPELVYTNNETGIKSVNYPQFTAVLLEGIKEQQTQIEDLKSEVETLKKQVQEIKDLLKK